MRELDSKQRAAAEWARMQETERDRTRAAEGGYAVLLMCDRELSLNCAASAPVV